MLSAVLAFVVGLQSCAAQSIIKKINSLHFPVNRILEGDVIIFSSTVRHTPEIFTCPVNEPCHILCLESPPTPPGMRTQAYGAPTSSSCGNLIVVAGNVPELKIICLDNACQGLQLQSSAEKNTVECLGHGACMGARVQCGAQSANKYLHAPVSPMVPIEACIITCSNGGCAGSPVEGGLPGAHIRCTGNVRECLVKANSAIDNFLYTPGASHRGSFTGAIMECAIRGPNSGNCNLECSDALEKRYCTGVEYRCRTNPRKCLCTDYCMGNPACKKGGRVKPDCPLIKNMKHTIPTDSPTPAPTDISPGPTSTTMGPTKMPSAKPTATTATPTKNPVSTANPTPLPTQNPVATP